MNAYKTLTYYHIDAFAEELFRGNPAGVCPLDEWLPARTLQSIAAENNLAETAFFVRNGDGYDLTWFTPETEIDLCGHATLAAAYVVFTWIDPDLKSVAFSTPKAGRLEVTRNGDLLSMLFPSRPGTACTVPPEIPEALGIRALETYKSRDLLVVVDSEKTVRNIVPDFTELAKTDAFGVIVTAPGNTCDFVSRYFAPGAGIPEDPVTGSSHCTLIPYWSKRLGKTRLTARQVSKRGGLLECEHLGDKVRISGKAVPYMKGEILLNSASSNLNAGVRT